MIVHESKSNYRWTVCSLLFFATTVNYLDRTVISLLKPNLEITFQWSETDYANIVIAFQLSYAFVQGTSGFLVARSFLGLTEAGNFPAAIKTVAEWFPKRERALATGIFNSGANIGAIIAPLTVPF